MYLGTEEIIFGIVMTIVCLGVPAPAVIALSGRRRAWTVRPPYNFTQVSARNTWPFMLTCMPGIWYLMTIPATYFEAIGDEEMRQWWWNLPFIWIPIAGAALSFVWWPGWLAPQWYRSWMARGGKRHVMPWTDSEIAAVEALPDGRRRRKTLHDIRTCRELVAAAAAS